MDYEQSYKEALDRAKKLKETCDSTAVIGWCEHIFPELKGNEDRKIRNAIYDALKYLEREHSWDFLGDVDILDAYTWLEKQNHDGKKWIYEDAYIKEREQLFQDGIDEVLENPQKYGLEKQNKQNLTWSEEDDKRINRIYDFLWKHKRGFSAIIWQIEEDANWLKSLKERVQPKQGEPKDYNSIDSHFGKHINKVEPKFKVGKWYQCTKDFFGKGVTFDKNTAYYCAKERCLQDEYGCHIAIVKDLYDNFKLWTIEDAKDGDVLACNEELLLFKSYSAQNKRISLYCWYNGHTGNFHEKEVVDILLTTRNKVYPASKEQRDLLFQKMGQAGYEWDAEQKELKKIEDEPENYKKQLMSEMADLVVDYIQQKPTWKPTEKQIDAIRLARSFVTDDFSDNPTLSETLLELEKQLKKIMEG